MTAQAIGSLPPNGRPGQNSGSSLWPGLALFGTGGEKKSADRNLSTLSSILCHKNKLKKKKRLKLGLEETLHRMSARDTCARKKNWR